MADKKISQLTALAAANLAPSTDVLAIVDTSATETKKIVAQDLINGVLNVASAVGIGTASPTDRLNVGAFSGNNVITIGAATTGTSSVYFGDGTGADRYRGYIDYEHTNDRFVFGTAGTGKAYLDSSGNLGLGVTPSAWSGIGKTLQINTGGSFSADSANAYFAANCYYNGTNWIYQTTNNATRYTMASNSHQWFTAPSGTAGNTISFTQAMALDANANLALNTTTNKVTGVSGGGNGFTVAGGVAPTVAVWDTSDASYYCNFSQVDAATYLWNIANGSMSFGTNNTERGRFSAQGYFKASSDGTYINATASYHEFRNTANDAAIVIDNPNATLTTAGVTFVRASRNTTNNTFYAITYYNAGADLYRFRVADSGDCTNTNGTYAAFSDIKLKQDIVDAASQWDDIKNLRVRKYRLKSDLTGPMQLGLVAQEAETVSPGLIDEHADRDAEGNDLGTTTKSVKYSVLYMKAVKALQEAMARIESLEADVAALKGAK